MTELECRLLGDDKFVVDGWTPVMVFKTAHELTRRGLLTCREIGSDKEQYTGFEFTITDKGREMRQGEQTSEE